MTVGALGEIVFQATEETIRTLDNWNWSGSARWAEHNRHNNHALTEFTGLDPDEISFSMYLSAFLGVDPMTDLKRLWDYERNGTPVALTVGDHAYGYYRWSVVSHRAAIETTDGTGNITSCTVQVSLKEYLRT